MSDQSKYIPSILVFIYHNNNAIDNYQFSFLNAGKNPIHFDNQRFILSDNLLCYLVCLTYKDDLLHYISYSEKNPVSKQDEKTKSINSTIIEIDLSDQKEDFKLFNDLTKYDDHYTCKALFKFATSKLKTQIRKAADPYMHYLFNIQPNGRILPQKELLEFAKEFIVYLPTLADKIEEKKSKRTSECNGDFFTEYIYFIFRKFWQSNIFGATALISAMYNQIDRDKRNYYISKKVREKIEKNNFSLPMDLEFTDMKFAEENLNLISESIITCNNAYLAFLAGYQISLHSKFIEITTEWMEDVQYVNIEKFAEIFSKKVVSTFIGREFYAFSQSKPKLMQTSNPKAVIQRFAEFSTIFLKNKKKEDVKEKDVKEEDVKEKDVKEALLKFKDEKYFTESLIESLEFKL